MNRYASMDQLWVATLADIINHGDKLDSRAGGCKEIVGWSAQLIAPQNNFVTHPDRKMSSSYACGELLWYLSQRNEVDMITTYAPSYANFANDGYANGAYGWRWANNPGIRAHKIYSNQFDAAITLLKKSPNTRQAVITSWDSGDVADAIGGKFNDIPCTLSLQFLLRDSRLHMVVSMRSNDAWLGLPYDVFCFTSIQSLMANALEVELGTYTHHVGSMHLYDKNDSKARKVLSTPHSPAFNWGYRPTPAGRAIDALTDADNLPCRLEKLARDQQPDVRLECEACEGMLLDDAVQCCWHVTRQGYDATQFVQNRALAQALKEK